MAATHSFIEFGDTLVVPLRSENEIIQETLSFMFVASLTEAMAKPLWEQYADYHSIRSVERFNEALSSNKSHIWSWLKLQASTSVNNETSTKPLSSLEDDLRELLCEFREDEQLKKQRRNMSLDLSM
ncbi:hypothetical protein [Vibrio crassostreae]|uniref:hypothetical protein n=1 Tax=Vibrio crassostreae TaxID=246167 RepID=UPI001B312E2F|nr:hypothetical protein [Vibrio crassostreae]